MKKTWLGYLSSLLLLAAGALMIAGGKIGVGVFFIVLSIAGLLMKIYLQKKARSDN
jgi:hypothetical protein